MKEQELGCINGQNGFHGKSQERGVSLQHVMMRLQGQLLRNHVGCQAALPIDDRLLPSRRDGPGLVVGVTKLHESD